MSTFRALPILARTVATTVRVCAPTVTEAALGIPLPRERADARLSLWASGALKDAKVDLHVHGREHIPDDETFVVMSNHQSTYDIFVVMDSFPRTIRMVSKREMRKVPLVGGAMEYAEFVFVDRDDPERAKESIELARQRIRSGVNVWIAPEGTRSPDGRVLPFKRGGIRLALDAGVRILPVTLIGTRDVMPSKGWKPRPGQRVDVHYHAPVDPEPFGWNRRAELAEQLRETIRSAQPDTLK